MHRVKDIINAIANLVHDAAVKKVKNRVIVNLEGFPIDKKIKIMRAEVADQALSSDRFLVK